MKTSPKTNRIKVKILSRMSQVAWLRHFPGGVPIWGNCEFILDYEARDYDWLIVYDDLPATKGERFTLREEVLACPQQNTLLMTTEPSTIKTYGTGFTSQFGYVLTSQEEWALPHPSRIFTQPALHWYYGVSENHRVPYDHLAKHPPLKKTRDIATVCSSKQQKHTLHNRRYEFTQNLKKLLPTLDIYGHGVRPMTDKAESLDSYRYHIALENFIGTHHWTEKLSDAFLGATLPFYCGCPNAADYFPEDSFITIDMNDVEGSYEVISKAMHDKEFDKRLPVILEARRLVLEKYNFFAVVSEVIENRYHPNVNNQKSGVIQSRKLFRKKHPLQATRYFFEKYKSRLAHKIFHSS